MVVAQAGKATQGVESEINRVDNGSMMVETMSCELKVSKRKRHACRGTKSIAHIA